jgi:hypothetical protein
MRISQFPLARLLATALLFPLSACQQDSPSSVDDNDAETGAEVESAGASSADNGDSTGDGDGDGDGDGAPDWPSELDHVFPQDYVVNIHLDFAEGDWASMINDFIDYYIKEYRSAAFSFGSESLPEIGARFKGFSSLVYIMDQNMSFDPTLNYPLKLNFDYFGGEHFHQLDKISLGNNWSDPSYMRERLAARAYEALQVPVARTSYAAVQVDDMYLGLYTMVQPIDKKFLKAHYGSAAGMDDGNLYKCSRTEANHCRLQWRGPNKSDYISTDECPVGYDECGLLLKTNEDDPLLNDYSDLINFLDVVNNSSDPEFATQIEEVFEVDSFLRMAAVTIGLSSFDSYFGMGNNFYLYRRPDTGRFEMIPWDFNMTYGNFSCGHPQEPDPAIPNADMTQAAVDGSFCGSYEDDYPLAERIFAVPEYLAAYQGYLRELAEGTLSPGQQQSWIDEFDGLIGAGIDPDPNYPGGHEDYLEALGANPTGGWGGYNLMDFVQRRQAFILDHT